MHIQPYLFFEGRCEEALNFSKKARNARVTMLMRHKVSPTPSNMVPPGSDDKIIHATFILGDSTINASDGNCGNAPSFQGFRLSISVTSDVEADLIFASLADGGSVQMPQGKTFFSPRFGVLTDRFGVSWMVMVQG